MFAYPSACTWRHFCLCPGTFQPCFYAFPAVSDGLTSTKFCPVQPILGWSHRLRNVQTFQMHQWMIFHLDYFHWDFFEFRIAICGEHWNSSQIKDANVPVRRFAIVRSNIGGWQSPYVLLCRYFSILPEVAKHPGRTWEIDARFENQILLRKWKGWIDV